VSRLEHRRGRPTVSGCGEWAGVPFILAKLQEPTHSYAPGLTGAAILTLIGGFTCLLLMRERRGESAAY